MADVIRIKRRVSPGSAGAPTSLANAELAYNEVDHTLYYGEGTGGAGGTASVIRAIGGDGLGSNVAPQMNGAAAAGTNPAFSRADHIHPVDTSRAPLNSPALTGTPTSTTPTPSTDNSTKIATTAFVQGALATVVGVSTISTTNGLSGSGSGAVTIGISANGIVNASLAQMPAHTWKGNNTGSTATPIDATSAQLMTDLGAAPLNSPSFTGIPTTAATPGNGDNSLKLATTAYVLAVRHDQLQAPTSDVPWGSKRITGLLDPSGAQDAATKAYVDATSQGIDAKGSCLVATTASITLSGTQTIDNIAVVAGNRVLVKNNTSATNGIYVVAAGSWTRALDADTWPELSGAFTFIEQGTINADSGWLCTQGGEAGGVLGVDSIIWTQFSGAGQITAGNGLTKNGNQLDVGGTAGRISIAADAVDIDAAYVGQTSITTLGNITTGQWLATTIAVGRGGTGVSTLTGYVKGNGGANMTASATIPNTDITGLGTMSTQNANLVAITGGTIDGITFDCGTF